MTRVSRLNYFFYKQSFLTYCLHMLQYWLSQGCIQMTRHDTLLSKFTPVAESSWPYLSPSLIVTVSYGPWCPAYHLVSAALPQIHQTPKALTQFLSQQTHKYHENQRIYIGIMVIGVYNWSLYDHHLILSYVGENNNFPRAGQNSIASMAWVKELE